KYSTNTKEDDFDPDKPVKYSTSPAAKWPANGYNPSQDVPKYQGIIVSLSVTIFLVYFCILREENDIDQKLTKNMDPEVEQFLFGLKAKQDTSFKNLNQ
ncbi:hypothetical protein WN55_04668, partial [Dufourea novaeangliae]